MIHSAVIAATVIEFIAACRALTECCTLKKVSIFPCKSLLVSAPSGRRDLRRSLKVVSVLTVVVGFVVAYRLLGLLSL